VQHYAKLAILAVLIGRAGFAQFSGSVIGTVLDPSGAVVKDVTVDLRNPLTGYDQTVATDGAGVFRFNNVPQSTYQLEVTAQGFNAIKQKVDVNSTVPVVVTLNMEVSEERTTVDVTASAALVDTAPGAHTDVDATSFLKLPTFDPAAGLSSIINNSTGGTAADANGFFHPLGDHAQVSFVVDGQSISDQQSKVFSTQLPANAVQSMELITGAPDAQYGDKSSLVVNATTKSGLGAKPFGTLDGIAGSFGTYGENATFGFGSPTFGDFIAINGIRTGHFLDTPEFLPIHDIGNNETIFDRIDYQPGRTSFHLDLFTARNWFQNPNSYDQLSQDQKQRVLTWNVAPGIQRLFGTSTLLTANLFARRDQVNYYGSRDPLDDTPATESQTRFLTNLGGKVDVSHTRGHHNLKFGTQIQQTRLLENFSLGITNPAFNPVCLDALGNPLPLPTVTDPSQCSAVNPTYQPNPTLRPGLVPYDLTRGGTYFNFHGADNISQYAFYATDDIRLKHFTIDIGVRDDQYLGLVSKDGIEPRVGISYTLPSNTVLRAAYSRTFETPFNENLLLSSATGAGGLAQTVFGAKASLPIQPGFRNQFNTGLQQKIGAYLLFDGDYFLKYTHNAYDFDVLFNTPITFPITWNNSKIVGLTGRLSTTNIHGFQAYTTFGHTSARYFPPENGGLIFQGTANVPGVFRIDHDQAFQQTTNLRYQRKKNGPWASLIWRYDSGLVVTGVPDVAAALKLTPAQQVDIGFSCGAVAATLQAPIRTCTGIGQSTLLTLPQTGTENNDHNPDRVKPRNLFDVALGTDNLLRSEDQRRMKLQLTVTNLTNKVALYNFLSTFSGTHFVAPRIYQMSVGYVF
jgi:outer membrane receptor protein involved in Fe transport